MVRRSFGGLVSGAILLALANGSSAVAGTVEPSARDYDLCARTVYGEMRGAPRVSQVAAVHIIYNRWKSGKWGRSIGSVVLAPRQFSVWNDDDPNKAVITDPTLEAAPLHKRKNRHFTRAVMSCAILIALREEGHPDPTGGCLYYWTGDKVPYWAIGLQAKQIGVMKCLRSAKYKKKRKGNKVKGPEFNNQTVSG